MGVTEGFMSAGAVLNKAHEHGATLSEFIIAILIESVYEGMAVRERGRPVVITVPVDLRRFFPAQTARNFFGVVKVSHNFKKDGVGFEQILANVRESLRSQLSQENLSGIIKKYSDIERNPVIKLIPLVAKIPLLRMSGLWAGSMDTAAFSNLGRISMPEDAARHIRLFDFFLSTRRPQICACSFGDTLSLSVSSPLEDTGLQRRFFRRLSGMGIEVRVVSNLDRMTYGEG